MMLSIRGVMEQRSEGPCSSTRGSEVHAMLLCLLRLHMPAQKRPCRGRSARPLHGSARCLWALTRLAAPMAVHDRPCMERTAQK